MKLINDINKLKNTEIKNKVNARLKEFSEFQNKDTKEWFAELCFCLLTANSKARTAIKIHKELGTKGFLEADLKEITECIKKNKHRFHNTKAKFIVNARKYKEIKEIIKKEIEPREWLVKNISGLGYKESSHFLRNVGYFDYAILDRHILNLMHENDLIDKIPKPLTKKHYLEIETQFKELSKSMNMLVAELDLYMWYLKAGEVLR